VLVEASPKFQFQVFTVPELAVEASVNATTGQAEVLELKFAVQVMQEMVTVLETEVVHPPVVVMLSVTVNVPFAA